MDVFSVEIAKLGRNPEKHGLIDEKSWRSEGVRRLIVKHYGDKAAAPIGLLFFFAKIRPEGEPGTRVVTVNGDTTVTMETYRMK